MKCRICGPMLLLLLWINISFSQVIRWDGGAGDSLWSNPLNWSGDRLPGEGDTALLDNSFFSDDYEVWLPVGETQVRIKSLQILPAAGRQIVVQLPSSNMAEPGMTATGPGDGLVIGPGGWFINASGISSGSSILVSDTIRVLNGGRYTHRCLGSHANNIVRVLARSPETAQGLVEFDVPSASYTLSLSGRTFGRLKLSASRRGGQVSYSGNGSSLLIRGGLFLDSGVVLSLNFSDTVWLPGNLEMNRSALNLANRNRPVVLALQGDWTMDSASVILESGDTVPQICLCGRSVQKIDCRGLVQGQVSLVLDNPAGASLEHLLRLPFQLSLRTGVLYGGENSYLALDSAGVILADTVAGSSYVEGPVYKTGLGDYPYFLFPVGASGRMRWMSLHQAQGTAGITYHRSPPSGLESDPGPQLHHLSALEYWSLDADSGIGDSARAELSFSDPNSGGVTDLAALRVAVLDSAAGQWRSIGQSGVTGSAGSSGSVTSYGLGAAAGAPQFLTLASISGGNPLPFAPSYFEARPKGDSLLIRWAYPDWPPIRSFLVEWTAAGGPYAKLLQAEPSGMGIYQFTVAAPGPGSFLLRLSVVQADGTKRPLRPVIVRMRSRPWRLEAVYPGMAADRIRIRTEGQWPPGARWVIVDAAGLIRKEGVMAQAPGNQDFTIYVYDLPAGLYHIFGVSSTDRTNSLRFFRQ